MKLPKGVTRDGKGFVNGTPPAIPEGVKVDSGQGYMRTTGKWRPGRMGSECEVYCLVTNSCAWVSYRYLSGSHGIRMFESLKGLSRDGSVA